eukprot:7250219-Karenia_brevis.AAC.1
MAARCRHLLPQLLIGARAAARAMVGRALEDMHLIGAIGVETAANSREGFPLPPPPLPVPPSTLSSHSP